MIKYQGYKHRMDKKTKKPAESPKIPFPELAKSDTPVETSADGAQPASELIYRTIFDNAGDAIIIHDLNGKILDVNRIACDRLGFTREELLRMTPMDFDRPEYAKLVSERIHQIITNKHIIFETCHVSKDGTQIPTEISGRFIEYDGKRAVLSICRDITERKRMDEALHESEKRYRTLFEQSPDGIALFDTAGKIIEFNDTAHRQLGYSREEFEKLSLPDIDAVWSPEEIQAKIGKVLEMGQAEFVVKQRTKQGEVREVYTFTKAIVLSGRQVFHSIWRDITELKLAGDSLRISEERLSLALKAAGQGIYDLDLRTGEAIVTPEYALMLGYDPAEFHETNAKWIERLHPDDKEPVAAVYRAYVKGEIPEYKVEFRQKTKDGNWKWLLSLGKIMEFDAEGNPLRMIGTHTDITERKRIEKALERDKYLLNATGRMAKVGGWEYDIPSDTLTWTDEVYHIHEVAADFQPSVSTAIDFYDLESRPVITKAMERAIEFGETFDLELRINTAVGNEVSVRALGQVHKKDGRPIKVVGTFQDISERKKLEEQLRQSHKMEAIGTLAGGVAHDFNNILMAIIGFGTMAQNRIKDDEKTKEFIKGILVSAERAAELTHSLLAFSRKQTITLKQVDLNDIVRKFNKMLIRVIGEDIKVTIMLINRELAVMADRGQIEQVMLNLATNARDAMPDGGELTIQTGMVNVDSSYAEGHLFENTGMYAVLTVSDTGMGMDQKTRENIFEPFFTTKEVGKGTGLGLAMVYGIVKQHGGDINVYSEPGKGTTFMVYLPMIATKAEEKSESAESAPLGSGETILLAEDDPQVRKVTGMYLREFGYRVIEAGNGEEAVKRFLENKDTIAIVLLDVIMPVKNGRDAYEEIKKLNPNIKAIFMSGYTDDIISRKGVLQEGLDFIPKPINPDTLIRKVRDVLDRERLPG